MEWKRDVALAVRQVGQPLETSLVEWKLQDPNTGEESDGALETSLVEWKLSPSGRAKNAVRIPWKLP